MQPGIQRIAPPGLVTSVLALSISILILIAPGPAGATEYHADPVAGNDSNPGTLGQPWLTLQYSLDQLTPGDTLNLHAGTYTSPSYFTVNVSGTPGNWITVRNYANDVVEIITANSGFYFTGQQYLIFDGLIVTPGGNNCFMAFGDYIIIRNCTLRDSALAVKCNRSTRYTHHLVENCTIYNHWDIPLFHDNMDSVIIRNNTIWDADSVLMDPGGVSNLVIDGNFAYNNGSRLGQLKIRWGNYEPQSGDNCRGAIVRRNVFSNGERYILLVSSANGAAVYNNTLCKIDGLTTESGILFMQQDGGDGGPDNNNDNRIKNNIFYNISGDSTPQTWFYNTFVFMQSSMSEDYADQEFDYNLYYKASGVRYIRYGSTWVLVNQVNGWYGGAYDVHSIAGLDPDMVNPTIAAGPDGFKLNPASPAIDAGGPLTTTIGAGSGTTVPVVDAKYFCDGLDLVDGDLIRIGSNAPVRVTARNIDTNMLTIDASISWSSGDWVNLDYNGAGPDIGAFETAGPATIEGRHVFYNDSAFDGNDPAANASDDGAIAPDKTALLPGGTAAFANYISYSRGINGVMVDIANLPGAPTASDFVFKVGNDSAPAGWATAPAPSSITVRAGAGASGSDRVSIIWADNAIANQWLQVTVLATANTGLAAADVFYFGDAIGETGNSPADAEVTPSDEIMVRDNPHTLANNPAAIDEACDFNRDRKVGPTDEILARNNGTSGPTALQLITVP